ncbi:MAG: PhoH family protein [Bacteroidales bacterium]|nr:PhoH family protein [Bacteroidales bacterium]MCF8328152.1 PhoH family protein [Bacteroidales bacterium]
MGEKEIILEDINPVEFFGVNDSNLELIKKYFPKLKIGVRGSQIKVIGDETETAKFEEKIRLLMLYYEKFGRLLKPDIARMLESESETMDEEFKTPKDVIVHGRHGKIIKARTINQQKMVESFNKNDLIFAIGPAGTGKTYTAVALAVRALKDKEVKRIILTRPAVEAGENLGFLPGDLRDKLDPYLQPLYDALRDMLPPQKLLSYLEDGTIEIAPLAFMRGRTLNDAIVILDEAQNASINQLKMFLTRMGEYSRFFVTGDVTQIDLPRNQRSGLIHAKEHLHNISGIDFIILDSRDVIRHKLVTKIINAYEKDQELKRPKQDSSSKK